MQTLERRNTYTPTDIPHVSGNCGLILNREETLSVSGLKTLSNLSDAAITATGQAGQDLRVPVVYVLNKRGHPLMPTTPRKARTLLKEEKAKVITRTPFTVQLTSATGETKQDLTLGIDSGYEHIGLSVLTETKEVYSAEVKLRTDMVSKGKLKLDIKLPVGFKPETFMSIVRWKLVNLLLEAGNIVYHTYGYITKYNRIALGLEKSHGTDAFVIAGGTVHERSSVQFLIKQVRKCNRKLFKGARSHIKNTAPRFIHGFQRYDKVLWNKIECFIFGRRERGYFNLQKLDGTKVHTDANVKGISLLENANTFLVQAIRRGTFLSILKNGVPTSPAPHGGL